MRQTRRLGPPCLRVQRENSPPDCFLIRFTPLTFALDLDPGAVDQQMQRTLRPPMRDVHGKALLATAERAEVRHVPVQADQAEQALDEASRLPQRHAEKDLHRQAGLDGSVAVDRLSPTLACRLAAHAMSGSNQIVRDPRRLSALLYAGQFRGL